MDESRVALAVDRFFKNINSSHFNYEDIRSLCTRLIDVVVSTIENSGVNDENNTFTLKPYIEIKKYDDIASIRDWVLDLMFGFINCMRENKGNKYNGLVAGAIKYIEGHYSEDITEYGLASKVYVTPNYFSKIFKEETGVKFVDWLNKYRMEKAEQLLNNSGMKIYEVAQKVGYKDYRYFTILFRKYKGYTPKEYRNAIH